jgi:hypothetical protein
MLSYFRKPVPSVFKKEHAFSYALYLDEQSSDKEETKRRHAAKASRIYNKLSKIGYAPAMYRHAMSTIDLKVKCQALLEISERYHYVPAMAELGNLYSQYINCELQDDKTQLAEFPECLRNNQIKIKQMLLDAANTYENARAIEILRQNAEVADKIEDSPLQRRGSGIWILRRDSGGSLKTKPLKISFEEVNLNETRRTSTEKKDYLAVKKKKDSFTKGSTSGKGKAKEVVTESVVEKDESVHIELH